MTIQELYEQIGGNYDHAMQIMRMDKMIAKYLQKLTDSDVCSALKAAGESMDSSALFESAHAMKGVCANLGLTPMYTIIYDMVEDLRVGKMPENAMERFHQIQKLRDDIKQLL